MLEFSDFINSCGLIEPLLEGGSLAMRMLQFCFALIVFSSSLSGKVIFREGFKLFSLR